MSPSKTPHPAFDVDEVEIPVQLPPDVCEYIKQRYKGVFENPNPKMYQLKKYADEAVTWKFVTEDGRDLVEAIGEACEAETVNITCSDCGHWESEERSQAPEAMHGFRQAEKIDGFLVCLECDSLFEDPEGLI